MNKTADIWKPVPKNPTHSAPRNYDVRITLNKSGKTRLMAIRFGFINDAAKAFENAQYIETSDVEKCADRIYFRTFNEKVSANAYKLSGSGSSRYTQFTPSIKAEKIYSTKWIGGTFKIKFDDECGWFFIEREADADERGE